MKEIVVISGKGGTGKTSLTASLLPHLPGAVCADCDVDAPDLAILLYPRQIETREFVGAHKARLIPDLCLGCGACVPLCRFEALSMSTPDGLPSVSASRCEGCGVCVHGCHKGALVLEDTVIGTVSRAQTAHGPMVQARLIPGEEASGKLVAEVRRDARALAEETGAQYIVVDGSPGIGCSVISSLTGADLAIIVTEPSVSAFRDLGRVHDLVKRFAIPAVFVVNKVDLSPEMEQRIDEYARTEGVPVPMKIPFSAAMIEAISDTRIPSLVLPEFFRDAGLDELLGAIKGA